MTFTRLRFQGASAPTGHNLPVGSDRSAVLPVGTLKVGPATGPYDACGLSATTPSQTTPPPGAASLAQTTHQDMWCLRGVTTALAAQTIAAGSWTGVLPLYVSSAACSAQLTASIYIWRPSTSSVVGYIYDSDTTLSAVAGTPSTTYAVTMAGSAVTTQTGDVLVVEVWTHITQSMATSYTVFVGNGSATTNVADAVAGVANGSPWINAPATVYYSGETVPGQAAVTQGAYCFYADGTESGSVALAAQNTAPVVDVASTVKVLLRVRLQSTNSTAIPATYDWRLQYEKNASGSWNIINPISNPVSAGSSVITDNAPTTQRLSAGTGSFTTGETALNGISSDFGWPGNNYTEVLYGVVLTPTGLADGDTVRFRVVEESSLLSPTYSQVPTLSVIKGAVAQPPRNIYVSNPAALQSFVR